MTEIFHLRENCRTFEAFCEWPPLGGSTGRVNGTRGQRTEDDPDFYPLRVIYGGHCPGGYVLARVFSGSVHL
jgi:hypothetical protein